MLIDDFDASINFINLSEIRRHNYSKYYYSYDETILKEFSIFNQDVFLNTALRDAKTFTAINIIEMYTILIMSEINKRKKLNF